MTDKHWLIAIALLTLTACQSRDIALDGTFPAPLIDKFPIAIGVYYGPDFVRYRHEEDIEQIGKVAVEAGQINVHLFDKLLPGLFTDVKRLSAPTGNTQVRAVLVPEIAEIQFSLPEQAHNELYEVWLRYNIKLQETDGKLIAQWPLTAYGKSPDGLAVFRAGGLNSAASVALRDAAASFTLSLRDVAEVQHWLEQATAPGAGNSRPPTSPVGNAPSTPAQTNAAATPVSGKAAASDDGSASKPVTAP